MKNKYKIGIGCVITAILIIAVDYVNNKFPSWINHHYTKSFESAKTNDTTLFEKQLRDGCYNLIESEGSYGSKTFSKKLTLWQNLTRKKSFTHFGFGEYGLLMHYSYLYVQDRKDDSMKDIIKRKFDQGFRENKTILERHDQTTYGIVAIDLYRDTKDSFYKQFADKLYLRLDSICQKEGIVTYREGATEQHVDAIGLICPFLFYYSKTFQNEQAKEIANRMIEEFIRWGTDNITGIPVQTYNIKNHVKLNHANWGRGISWFLLGVLNYEPTDSAFNSKIKLLEQTVLSDEDHLYSQYFSQGNNPDMSATIPVIYYLMEKQLLKMNKTEITSLISPYCDKDGIVRFCSPSILYPHEDVSVTMGSLQSQGILLYLQTFR